MRIYAAEFLSKLAQVCADREVLLIVDEIATGFGRTGRMFAFEHAGIVPDLVCVGKGLSGGYLPISATIVKKGIYDTFRDQPDDHTFYHGHTFSGNPIAAACAVEALTVYREERIVERAARLGEILAADLAPVAAAPGVRNVRSLGMIGVVELEDDDQGTGAVRAARIGDRLRVEGILLRPLGPVLYVMPPLTIDEATMRALVQSMAKAVEEVRADGS